MQGNGWRKWNESNDAMQMKWNRRQESAKKNKNQQEYDMILFICMTCT